MYTPAKSSKYEDCDAVNQNNNVIDSDLEHTSAFGATCRLLADSDLECAIAPEMCYVINNKIIIIDSDPENSIQATRIVEGAFKQY